MFVRALQRCLIAWFLFLGEDIFLRAGGKFEGLEYTLCDEAERPLQMDKKFASRVKVSVLCADMVLLATLFLGVSFIGI